jgi:hypothetical protein
VPFEPVTASYAVSGWVVDGRMTVLPSTAQLGLNAAGVPVCCCQATPPVVARIAENSPVTVATQTIPLTTWGAAATHPWRDFQSCFPVAVLTA